MSPLEEYVMFNGAMEWAGPACPKARIRYVKASDYRNAIEGAIAQALAADRNVRHQMTTRIAELESLAKAISNDCNDMACERNELRAELAERDAQIVSGLVLDAARGNWLIEYMASPREDLDDLISDVCVNDDPTQLRNALDAIMAKEAQG
jgi:hypothetical protein